MANLQITTMALGLGLAAVILYLVRRDHLYLPYGVFWFLVALAAVVFGLSPRLIDTIAAWVGVAYPPAFLFLCVGLVLFVKALHADMVNTRIERELRRLNQELAILSARQRQSEAALAAPARAAASPPHSPVHEPAP